MCFTNIVKHIMVVVCFGIRSLCFRSNCNLARDHTVYFQDPLPISVTFVLVKDYVSYLSDGNAYILSHTVPILPQNNKNAQRPSPCYADWRGRDRSSNTLPKRKKPKTTAVYETKKRPSDLFFSAAAPTSTNP